MSINLLALLLTLLGTGCWVVCFWWMYRISEKQNSLLDRLTEQGRRIEKLSRIEHDLIKEVHPQVGEIKEGMEEMIAAVKENTEITVAAAAAPAKSK
jgi:sensor histidine kinase YesM